MNKADLISAIAEKGVLSRRDAEAAIDEALEIIKDALVRGEDVKLSGFGIFSKKDRAERIGTNPSTRETIRIAASKSVSFKPSKNLKEELNK
ncbi:MAG: HU family DNA-binding protein [Candidatus Enteromonas sp.]|nr:HU family DNA-binding protein [Candidatus Enteromonas sp.]